MLAHLNEEILTQPHRLAVEIDRLVWGKGTKTTQTVLAYVDEELIHQVHGSAYSIFCLWVKREAARCRVFVEKVNKGLWATLSKSTPRSKKKRQGSACARI